MKNRYGFTLTELLAVVIIIGILTGLSLGGFRQAFERSHFAEGLQAGAALNGAVNRYYYDHLYLSEQDRKNPASADLDIGLSNTTACSAVDESERDVCFRTKYFEVLWDGENVWAYRVKNGQTKDYALEFFPDFSSTRAMEKCVVLDNSSAGKNLCISMGYTQVSNNTYSKPNAN